MASPTAIVAYLALFVCVGFVFLLVHLVLGRFVRPDDPHEEKKEIYECGEPAIGSSFVQFDLRFYVVALVFIVFDAEVAFLFPAATVFGKQTQLADPSLAIVETGETDEASKAELTAGARGLFQELQVGEPNPAVGEEGLRADIRRFTWYVYAATLFFFFVLFVGFAYEWKTGAFDWVRAVISQRGGRSAQPPPSAATAAIEPALQS
jgi:NADH-quinone oxidoreductase subunit A